MLNFDDEKNTVQKPMIKYAGEIGWKYISSDEALSMRQGESGLLFRDVLREKLIELNPGVINPDNVDDVVNRIESVRNNIDGNYEVLKWLRGEKSIYVKNENRERNISLIDYSNINRNAFHLTDEWSYTNGKKNNRADIIFVINGIPVAIVETKSELNNIDDALLQIQRYHSETPELMTFVQIFLAVSLTDFRYGVSWNMNRKNIFKWKDEENADFEKKVKVFFLKESFLGLIKDWIVFYLKDDELNKIVLRQHQIRAVEKVVGRAIDPAKKRGLVWHTQGSGKTFTMIKSAELLIRLPVKPTVLMLVDRNELEGQLSGWIRSILGSDASRLVKSKRELKKIIKNDYRGLVVSMIHKFDSSDEILSERSNIFVLIDEAHRSTGGNLGNYLMSALPNATLIGFTGTPVDKTVYGKGTFKVFGAYDRTGYLDKYSIVESIEDGTTLSLKYSLAQSRLKVPSDMLEKEFLGLKDVEGISDIDELNRILERAINLKNFIKAPDRIDKIAEFVAKHFKSNVEPLGYKAFLVAVDREACAMYKEALDKHLDEKYSRVVYTAGKNDSDKLRKYYLSETDEKMLRREFLNPDSFPKILIVTDKLLTGYDAPLLYSMYLDKPMRDHTLLQAIARVNRPYENDRGKNKPFGLIVDFIGIFDRLEKALSFDSDEINGVIENISVVKDKFARLMEKDGLKYLELCRDGLNDKSIEDVIEFMSEIDEREKFFGFYRELSMLYEVISPDSFLRKYMNDYLKLSELYKFVKKYFTIKKDVDLDFGKKTEELVRDSVSVDYINELMPQVEITAELINSLKASKDENKKKVGVINLVNVFINEISDIYEDSYLIPIKERAQKILEIYEKKQISTEEVINEIQHLYNQYQSIKKDKDESGLDKNTFKIYSILKLEDVENAKKLAAEINSIFEKYPAYADNPTQMRDLKAELYKELDGVFEGDKIVSVVKKIIET